jgi:Pvc16 N-terminal domain
MIHSALKLLTSEINQYLSLRGGVPPTGDWAVLTNVATEQGTWAIPNDTIGVSLINIEEERVFKDQQTTFKDANGRVQHYNPELKLNLYMLVSAHFVNGDTTSQSNGGLQYFEGLERLSSVIMMFQGKSVYTPDNTPAMGAHPELKKLIVELHSYTFEQQYNFWSIVGAKYLPSVLYRIRLVTFQEARPLDSQLLINSVDANMVNEGGN